MFAAKPVNTEHADIIHDVSFDHHGKRMATCSSDQTVKVWDEGNDGKWHCTASWRTHYGSVWRVTWAHPEYGQVLATCSFDRTVAVWEELSKGQTDPKGSCGSVTWSRKAYLVDSRTSVADVRFGPKHLGLLLATCSSDGIVRVYEAVDVMNLSNWQLQHEFAVTINNVNISLSCLSWSGSRLHPATIAVGSDDRSHSHESKVFIYRYNDGTRKWDLLERLSKMLDPIHDVEFNPHLGRSFHSLAVASTELDIFTLREKGPSNSNREDLETSVRNLPGFEVCHVGRFDSHKSLVWRVSWSVLGNKLASTGNDGCVLLWKANYLGQWKCYQSLKSASGGVGGNFSEMERASLVASVSMSTTPTSSTNQISDPLRSS